MERTRSKPVQNLPETIHSLLGLKSHLTSAWVKSVCNIVNNVSSSSEISSTPKEEDDDDSVSTQLLQSIRGTKHFLRIPLFFFLRFLYFFGTLFLNILFHLLLYITLVFLWEIKILWWRLPTTCKSYLPLDQLLSYSIELRVSHPTAVWFFVFTFLFFHFYNILY